VTAKLVLVAALALGPAATAAARPTLTLTPSTVRRGHVVGLRGSAVGCPAGDTVELLSRAFVHAHDFAGVPAVYAMVRPGGAFGATTRIPASKAPGRYTVTGRCGGGNLGFLKHLTVRR
jgi:hypothetical protein